MTTTYVDVAARIDIYDYMACHYKKLSYRRGTARCVVSVEILPIATQQCRNGDAENARHENARNAIVWKTECCICLSIAEQECRSRQERAPDLAADCVLVND